MGNVGLVLHACHAITQRMDTINAALIDIRSGVQRVQQKIDVATTALLGGAPKAPTTMPFSLSALSDANAALLDNMLAKRSVEVPTIVHAEPAIPPSLHKGLDLLPSVFAGHALAPLEALGEDMGNDGHAGHVLPLSLLQFEPVQQQFDGHLLDPYMTITLPHTMLLPDAVQPGG